MKKIIIDCVDFCKALGDPIRQRILEMLLEKEMSVNDIVEEFDVSQPTISHHLNLLFQTDLVKREKHGKQIIYSINHERVVSCCGQLNTKFETKEE